jgi:hypothetical protein
MSAGPAAVPRALRAVADVTVVSGGTLHRSLAAPSPDPRLLAWAALQKDQH